MLAFVFYVLVASAVVLGGWYGVYFLIYKLAEKNILWTIIQEGTSKTILDRGRFYKSILVKKGHKLDDANWDVTPLKDGETDLSTGLYWIGIPPFRQVYTRTMKFVKALPSGDYAAREEKNIDFLLTGTQYQYALLFEGSEDAEKLPLSGQMTMTARIMNPYKALFLVHEWFDALVSRVLPRVRQYISEHTYEELIRDKETQLDVDVFKMLSEPAEAGKPSILKTLLADYGIELIALETVSIAPPKAYLEATLRQFNAQQTAKAEAEETGGALDRMVEKRLNQLALRLGFFTEKNGVKQIDQAKLADYLVKNENVLRTIEQEQLDLLRRDRAGKGLREIRVANSDGSKLEGGLATLFSGIEAWRGSGKEGSGGKDDSKPTDPEKTDNGGNPKPKKKGEKYSVGDMEDMLLRDLEEEEEEEKTE